MKTTIDIPDDVLRDAMKLTKASSKRDAVVGAMQEYVRRQKLEAFLKTVGTSDTFMTQEELMDMRLERGRYRVSR